MNRMLAYSLNDFKLVFRDSSLRIFWIMPFMILMMINLLLPYLCEQYPVIKEYVPYVLMMSILQTANMFSFIYSLVLIDEKDTQVAKVYGVMPVSHFAFTITRMLVPFLMSVGFSILILYTQPFYQMSFGAIVNLSILSGLMAPIIAIAIAILSKNKMDGMTWNKFFGLPISLPILAFFVPVAYQSFFGILPTHWLFQSFDNVLTFESYWFNFFIGIIFSILLISALTYKFIRVHFR